ncbi:MAG: cyclic nucleotide-binding domain-containing protein [Candidatus Rokuibacteriota bacterium]
MSEGVLGREYGNGEVICRQGEPGDRMYVIQAGRATVVREENGAEVVVGELGAGDVFGEMAIFDRQRAGRRRASLDRDLRSRPFVVIHPQGNTLSR